MRNLSGNFKYEKKQQIWEEDSRTCCFFVCIEAKVFMPVLSGRQWQYRLQ